MEPGEEEHPQQLRRLVWEDPELNYDTLPQPYSFIVELLDETISDVIDDHDAAKNRCRQNHVDVNDLISVGSDASVIVSFAAFTFADVNGSTCATSASRGVRATREQRGHCSRVR